MSLPPHGRPVALCGCGSVNPLVLEPRNMDTPIKCGSCTAHAPSLAAWNAGYRENTRPRRSKT